MNTNFIIHKNNFKKKLKDIENIKKLKKNFFEIFNDINSNLDIKKNTFHILSKDFKLNFPKKKFDKLNKFKIVVIIGMGGSILGSNAIYNFLQYKIKKNLFFLITWMMKN